MSTVTAPRGRRASPHDGPTTARSYGRYVYALVLVWGVGDVASTFLAAAATGSVAGELNPLMALVLEVEPLLLPLVKALVVLVTAGALFACQDTIERVPGWRVWFVTMLAAGTLVVCNNTAVAALALV